MSKSDRCDSSRRAPCVASPVADMLVALLGLVAVVALTACGGQAKTEDPSRAIPTEATQKAVAAQPYENFDPAKFTDSIDIDNQWMPLRPGTRLTYDGTTIEDDGTAVPHRIVVNVTDLTKVIGGVRSVVTWDLDYSDNELVEAELAFYAQDDDGNVWYLGEYPEEYDEGRFVAAAAWIHGFEDARAGIMMKAVSEPGTPSYSQGWGPAVDWTDRGRVDQIGQQTSVPAGTYADVVVIAESSASEPDAEQLKYYAPGVGNVRVGWRGAGEKVRESLELTRVEQLDRAALAEVRAEALKMEKSAYTRRNKAYAATLPLEQRAAEKTEAPQ